MDGWGKKRHSGLVTRLDAGGRMRHPPNFLRNVVPSFFTQFDESYILLGKLASVKKFFYGNIEPLRLASPRFLAQSFPRFESIRACSATSFGRVFSPRFFRKIVCEGKVSGKRRARVIFSRCGLLDYDRCGRRLKRFFFFFFGRWFVRVVEKMFGKVFERYDFEMWIEKIVIVKCWAGRL